MRKNRYFRVLIPVFLVLLIVWAADLIKVPQKTQPFKNIEVENVSSIDERFILEIPKIFLTAPIIPDVAGNDQELYDKALESGVAQYLGTGKPGEGKNIFIFGHSSNYIWAPGEYKEVFRYLNQLSQKDEITIIYHGKKFDYKVVDKKVVKPNQTDVLMRQDTGEQLTLMTCTPVGTSLNRLIIVAKPDN